MTKVAVIGTGAWGTALALCLLKASKSPLLFYSRSSAKAEFINQHLRHPDFPDLTFSENLEATSDLEALVDLEAIFIAVPTQNLRDTLMLLRQEAPALANKDLASFPSLDKEDGTLASLANRAGPSIVLCSKGIENKTSLLPSEIAEECGFNLEQIAILSGPNFASELVQFLPAITTIAAQDSSRASNIALRLCSPHLGIELSNDTLGVQIVGALKNLFAIGAGIIAGLNLGNNAAAAYLTRTVKEMGLALEGAGAKLETLWTAAAIGDLILTASSVKSRNYSFGLELAKNFIENELGDYINDNDSELHSSSIKVDGSEVFDPINNSNSSPDKALKEGKNRYSSNTIEGYHSVKAIKTWAYRHDIQLEICELLYEIVHKGKDPRRIIEVI